MKRNNLITVIALLIVFIGAILFYFAKRDKRSHVGGSITRIQFYADSELIAIHIEPHSETENQYGVFVMSNVVGENKTEFLKWLSPDNVDIHNLEVIANSIYEKWDDSKREEDVIQFGIHGLPLGDTRPQIGGKVAIGIAQEPFKYNSFQFITEDEYSQLKVSEPTYDRNVSGHLYFSRSFSSNSGKKPFIIP